MPGSEVVLQPRDRRLLDALNTFRIVDREQASILAPFNSVPRANARLLALTRAGLLTRSFVGTVPGGRRALYRKRGDRARWSEAYARHQLGINAVHLALARGADTLVTFENWQRFRSVLAPDLPLIPDGYAELVARGNREGCFVEVDQGTETRAVWTRKAELYLRLACSGLFARIFAPDRFRVIVLAPTDRRARSIRAAISRVTPKLFYISDLETINGGSLFSSVWLRPAGDGRHPLY
jgi:hypothetical protein